MIFLLVMKSESQGRM